MSGDHTCSGAYRRLEPESRESESKYPEEGYLYRHWGHDRVLRRDPLRC